MRSYEIDLWDGLKSVNERYDEGKRVVKELIEILKERISSEDVYSKGLLRITKSTNKEPEKGTVNAVLTATRNQVDACQKQHATISTQLSQNFLTPLEAFKKEQSKTKKQLEGDIAKLNKELERSKTNLAKLSQKYQALSKDFEVATKQNDTAIADPTFPPKELAKLKTKVQTLQKQVEQADVQYQGTIPEHQATQQKYAEEMKKILQQFQQMDEKRGEFLKSTMEKYVYASEALISGHQQALLSLKEKVEAMDEFADLQQFLDEKQTDQKPAEFVQYVPYVAEYVSPNATISSTLTQKAESPKETQISTKLPTETRKQQDDPPKKEVPKPKKPEPKTTSPRTKKAKALYDYVADEDNELSFHENDIITVTKEDSESGWWEGEFKGAKGMFPGNYVQLVDDKEQHTSLPPPARPPPQRKCKVLFDFTAETEDELSIREGEIIIINSEAEGWMLGTNEKGKQGLFPANYVEN